MWLRCECGGLYQEEAQQCARCGRKFGQEAGTPASAEPTPPLVPVAATAPAVTPVIPVMPIAQVPPTAAAPATKTWKLLGVIAGVLVLGAVFGTAIAVALFGTGTTASATASPSPPPRTPDASPQVAFDTNFKSSCRQSAMRTSGVSQAMADRYCDCALSELKKKSWPWTIVQTCKQQIMR